MSKTIYVQGGPGKIHAPYLKGTIDGNRYRHGTIDGKGIYTAHGTADRNGYRHGTVDGNRHLHGTDDGNRDQHGTVDGNRYLNVTCTKKKGVRPGRTT